MNQNYLIRAELLIDKVPNFINYPFNLPIIKNLDTVSFHPKLTFIVGENGSGKSTLIEAIAMASGFNPEGGSRNFNFRTKDSHSNLNEFIRLARSPRRPKDGYFLRAESFYNVASHIDYLDEDPLGGPPVISAYGEKSLHQQSHGESFFSLMMNRFKGNGLYILDEPEAALSPTRQMAILSRIHQLIRDDSQFIIATHSPILMSYPDAIILEVSNGLLVETRYEDTDHYKVTKGFLNSYPKHLEQLLHESD